jgi:uncharacterized protein (TIGR02246 family)
MMTRRKQGSAAFLLAIVIGGLAGQLRTATAQPKPPAPGPAATVSTSATETPGAGLNKDFAAAFNKADAKALAALFTEDGVIVDTVGAETRGRAAIEAMYAGSFQEVPGLKLESEITEDRPITADVARTEGRSRSSIEGGDASEFNRFSSLLVRRNGKWLIAEIREYPAPPEDISPYDRLQELEWMVGDWVDESGQNKVVSSVRWADNQSFLVRTYVVEIAGEKAASGTMFIGWDPQSGQIKSWLFDSHGGHGEGLWTRVNEKEWVVKAQGVLRDGQPTSATQTHTVLTPDSVKTSSVDRVIGGRLAPDIPEILMVRKPPQPTAPGTPAAAKPVK